MITDIKISFTDEINALLLIKPKKSFKLKAIQYTKAFDLYKFLKTNN